MVNDQERLWLQKCIEAFRNEDYDGLLKSAGELEKCGGDLTIAAMYRGMAYYHKKMFKDAQKIFYSLYLKKLAKEKQEDQDILYYLALCNIFNGETRRAIALLSKLKANHPMNVDYKIMLYLAYFAEGNPNNSIGLLEDEIALNDIPMPKTLEGLLLKSIDNRELSGTAKVLLLEMLRKLRKEKR